MPGRGVLLRWHGVLHHKPLTCFQYSNSQRLVWGRVCHVANGGCGRWSRQNRTGGDPILIHQYTAELYLQVISANGRAVAGGLLLDPQA